MFWRLARLVTHLRRQDGQALAEYGLLLALIAVAAVIALTALGLAISGTFDDITAAIS